MTEFVQALGEAGIVIAILTTAIILTTGAYKLLSGIIIGFTKARTDTDEIWGKFTDHLTEAIRELTLTMRDIREDIKTDRERTQETLSTLERCLASIADRLDRLFVLLDKD